MKSFPLIALVVACIILSAMALPTPAHVELLDGKQIRLSGATCKDLLANLFEIEMETIPNPRNPSEMITVPSVAPYPVISNQPFDGMGTMVLDSIRLEKFDIDYCTIDQDPHGYEFSVHGINADISADLAYEFEKDLGLGFDHDSTHLEGAVRDVAIHVRLDAPSTNPNHFNSMEDLMATYGDGAENDNISFWDAQVITDIPEAGLKIHASDSKYSGLYNNLLETYSTEIQELFSLVVSKQLEVWIEEFCLEDDQCSDLDGAKTIGMVLNEHVREEIRQNPDNVSTIIYYPEDEYDDEYSEGEEEPTSANA